MTGQCVLLVLSIMMYFELIIIIIVMNLYSAYVIRNQWQCSLLYLQINLVVFLMFYL